MNVGKDTQDTNFSSVARLYLSCYVKCYYAILKLDYGNELRMCFWFMEGTIESVKLKSFIEMTSQLDLDEKASLCST